jgi:hypothetical protein
MSIMTKDGRWTLPEEEEEVGKWKACHQEREFEHFGVTNGKAFVVTFYMITESGVTCADGFKQVIERAS